MKTKSSLQTATSTLLLAVFAGGFIFSVASARGQSIYEPYAITTLAGLAPISGTTDNTGSAARFNQPWGVAVDNAGNLYVADTLNHSIRKIAPGGIVTTLAGGGSGSPGFADGPAASALFSRPTGVAVDAAGTIFVADYNNHLIRQISGGVVSTLAGSVGVFGINSGTGTAAEFHNPFGVAVNSAGTFVFVTDQNNQAIRMITVPGGVVTTLAGAPGVSGSNDDPINTNARFNTPKGIAVDQLGNLYVADTGNFTVRKIGSGGGVSTLAGLAASSGFTDAIGSAARFSLLSGMSPFGGPCGVAVDGGGNVYVTDQGNHLVRKITSLGSVTTLGGLALTSGSADGTGSSARFNNPAGVAVDGAGTLYVADTANHTIRAAVKTNCLQMTCATNKAVACGSAWDFDAPSATSCCATSVITVIVLNTVTNGLCPTVVTRTWQATDGCGNTNTCSQIVTVNPAAPCVVGGTWTPRETIRNWTALASSDDGSKLVAAVDGGRIYTSTDSGATWTPRESNRFWSSVASSSDGSKLAAVVAGGQIYTSSDSGVTWTPRETSRNWHSVASSSAGSHLVAVAQGGLIYTSTDSGVTWTAQSSGVANWEAVASSADGSHLVAAVSGGLIYTSPDFGVTWTAQSSGVANWQSVASSADGSHLVAVALNGQIYTSPDGGVTWTARESNRNWSSVASSADGSKLVAVVSGGQIYTSADGGVTWTPRETSRGWSSVACSTDGSKVVAGVYAGQLYTSACPQTLVTVCAPDKTVACGTAWSFDPPVAVDSCTGASATLMVINTVTNGLCPMVLMRTWLVTDGCGNTNTCSQTVTVLGTNTPPTICLNPMVTVFSAGTTNDDFVGAEPAFPSAGLLTRLHNLSSAIVFKGFDDCAINTFFAHTFTNLPPCITGATLHIRLKACGSTLDLNDTFNLGFTGPSGAQLPSSWGRNLGTANGVPGLFNEGWAQGSIGEVVLDLAQLPNADGSTTNLIAALSTQGFLDLVLQDDTSIDFAVLTVTSCCATNAKTVACGSAWTFDVPTVTDACGGTNVTITILNTVTNGTACSSVITRTWLATDGCGRTNTSSQTVTVIDTTPPVFICATNKTVQCGTPWTFDAPTATDACSGTNVTITILNTVTNGSACALAITRTWLATDTCGNTNTCSQTVTVVDLVPPVFVCPTNKTVECGSKWDFNTPMATDGCSGTNVTVIILTTVTNGTACSLLITRTWLATDGCGNTNTCSQTVTVVDTTPPIVICAGDKTVGGTNAWKFDPPTAVDLCCGSNVTITVVSTVTNAVACGLAITRTWSVTDCCSNSVPCIQTVTVVNKPPSVCATASFVLNAVGNLTDNFAGPEPASPSPGLVMRLQAAGGTNLKRFDDCTPNTTFAHTFANLPSCIVEATLTIRVRACNPSATNDSFGLSFTTPSGTLVPLIWGATAWGRYLGNGNSGGVGLCNTNWTTGAERLIVLDLAHLPNANGSTTDLLWALNSNGYLDLILKEDSAIDYAILAVKSCCCQPDVVVNLPEDACCAVVNYPPPAFATNCSPVTITCFPPSGTCFPVGTNLVECTATDAFGQVARCYFKVIVRDLCAPVITSCPVRVFACLTLTNNVGILPNVTGLIVAGDNCTPTSQLLITQNPPAGTPVNNGSTVTITVTDSSGNSTHCTVTVLVQECCVTHPTGLALWLTFDELGGSTAYNSVGGNNGTLTTTGVTRNAAGYVNQSVRFDGVNGFVTVPSYPAIVPGTNSLTIDAWIQRATNSGTLPFTRVIVDKRQATTAAGYSFVSFNGKLLFQMNGANYSDSVLLPTDSAWHFVAVVVARTASSTVVRFYVDGLPTGVVTTTAPPANLTDTSSLRVGSTAYFNNPAKWFGSIDEVELYNRALKPEEILGLYTARAGGKCRPSVTVPLITSICAPANSAVITAQICNASPVAQTFIYYFQPSSGPGCTWSGPISFSAGWLNAVTVAPNSCTNFPVTITAPGMTPGAVACYEMVVIPASATNDRFTVPGKLAKLGTYFCLSQVTNLVVTNIAIAVTNLGVFVEVDKPKVLSVTLTSSALEAVDLTGARFRVLGGDRMPDLDYVSLNGLPPGVPAEVPVGTMLPTGGQIELSVSTRFVDYSPGSQFTLVLELDLDASGEMAPIASVELINQAPRTDNILLLSRDPAGALYLDWPGELWMLEESTSISGPWSLVSGMSRPFMVAPAQRTSGYYRLLAPK